MGSSNPLQKFKGNELKKMKEENGKIAT